MGQIFSLNDAQHSNIEQRSSIDPLSDEEISALIDGIRDEDAIGFRRGDYNGVYRRDSLVHPISYDAVLKYMFGPEPFMMAYVSSHTSIPIPRIRRVLHQPSHDFNPWILDYTPVVMDRIDGEPLETAWPQMSWWARLRVIWCIRSYIRQLQNIPIPYPNKPGPFDALGRRHVSLGLFFTSSGAPPCESYDEMADWYDRRRFDAMVLYHRATGNVLRFPKFDRKQPFVICHGDLNTSNIIVDRRGIPWIIDWGEAGVYPIWLDYAKAAVQFNPYAPSSRPSPWLWRWATRFMFGNYGKYVYNYLYIMGGLGIWDNDAHDASPDYFTKQGLDVD